MSFERPREFIIVGIMSYPYHNSVFDSNRERGVVIAMTIECQKRKCTKFLVVFGMTGEIKLFKTLQGYANHVMLGFDVLACWYVRALLVNFVIEARRGGARRTEDRVEDIL